MTWLGSVWFRRHPRLVTRSDDGHFAFRRLIAFMFAASCLHAHSLHQSTAEAEYNPTTKKLEVSLTVFINDLETALVRQSEREMRLNQTPAAEFDAQIQAYLAKTFVVTDAAGKTAKIEWVGRQTDEETKKSGDPTVTLFFEIALPGGLTNAKLRHAVFCEMFQDQVNLILVRENEKKVEFRSSTGDGPKRIGGREGSNKSIKVIPGGERVVQSQRLGFEIQIKTTQLQQGVAI